MKKFQIGALAMAAVLVMGGGSVFASDKASAEKSIMVNGMSISASEDVLKDIEDGKIQVMIDETEGEEFTEDMLSGDSIMIGDLEIKVDDQELLKDIEDGKVQIMVEEEDGSVVDAESVMIDGIEIITEDQELLKALKENKVEVKIED